MKHTLVILFLFCTYVFSDVNIIDKSTSSQLNLVIKNNTSLKWEIDGWGFIVNNDKTFGNPLGMNQMVVAKSQVADGYKYTYNFKVDAQMVYKILQPGDSLDILYSYNSLTTSDIVSASFVMLKTGSFGASDIPDDEQAINIEQVDSLLLTANFYNSDYRYLDSLGMRGGTYSGGFLDTWKGETQILFPYNNRNIYVSNTNNKIIADSSNAIYWLTLAMGQEYFNVDMQLMMALGAKETMAGTPLELNFNNNGDGAYGPFEVESTSGLDRALSYYFYFPEYSVQLGSATDITSSGIDVTEFMQNYMDEGAYSLNTATAVNGYMFSIINQFSIYDFFNYAEDVCWKDVLDGVADQYFGMSAIAVAYNLGLWGTGGSQAISTMTKDSWEATNLNPNASDLLPTGNSDYRIQIRQILDSIVPAVKEAYSDISVELWDYLISWNEVERFFLGELGSIEVQGKGGLLKHFEMEDTDTRNLIINILSEGFNKLKGNSPSSMGTDKISFRYDWLTLLRTVKNHFPREYLYKKPLSGDAASLIAMHSAIGGCSSLGIDTVSPDFEILSFQISTNIDIVISATDNNSVKEVKWTTDASWSLWHNATYTSGTGGNQNFQISVSEEYKGNVQNASDVITDVWIMVIDESGKSTVKKQRFSESVGIKKQLNSGSLSLNIKTYRNQIRIDFNKDLEKDLKEVELFSLNGKKIKSIKDLKISNRALLISTASIPASTYIMRIKGRNIKRDYKICITD